MIIKYKDTDGNTYKICCVEEEVAGLSVDAIIHAFGIHKLDVVSVEVEGEREE